VHPFDLNVHLRNPNSKPAGDSPKHGFAATAGTRVLGAMIDRYTRPEIGAVWSQQAKFDAWLEVELAVCDALARAGTIPDADIEQIRSNAAFTVDAVNEREQTTNHDVAAFVDVVAASIGDAGRWFHYGLTSSDVLDTALALQLKRAGEIVVAGAREHADALAGRALEFQDTVCVGRTHGIHAEPTTFGVKLAGFAFEARRNVQRLEGAFAQVAVGALSGAVGTYSANGPQIEAEVLAALGLAREDVSTQVVARDRHAELLAAIATAGAGLERFATEIRGLQKTEVREVEEPFASGKQKGSSAMPHKRNPIICERVAGLARVLRGNAQAGFENVALWHERDISHSSVERVILPDSTILLDYMQSLATRVATGMTIHEDRMRANLDTTHGALFSQRALLALVDAGLTRDDAYRIVQRGAQEAWDTATPFRELLAQEAERAGVALDLESVFDAGAYTRHAREIVARLDD
jgi:adenylosuccinate lyase